jgi:cytochrome c-type biogenesis protein CcmH/NrfF
MLELARRFAVAWLLLAGLGTAAAAPAVDTAADPALEERVKAVSAELRCLVCQNQNLADSHAGLALDLKNQVREQLRAGRTPEQVVAYMTDRYGDFVRYRPPFKATTWLLWLGPALLLALGLWGLSRALRRHALNAEPGGLTSQDELRAAALLQGVPATDNKPHRDR